MTNSECIFGKIDKFLDGPGNIEENIANNLGRSEEYCRKYLIIGVFIATIIFSLLFYFFPQIDINFSNLFFTGNREFIMSNHPLGVFYSKIIMKMLVFICIALGVAYLAGEFMKKPVLGLTRRRVIFIALSISLTAGLVTNAVLKNNWGRARPRDVVQFGGDLKFSPACAISDQCHKNCSFVSGDTSFAFSFFCLVLLVRRRKLLIGSGFFLFASSVGLMRVLRGAHFLSDVVLAGFYTVFIILLLECLLLATCKNKCCPDNITKY